MKLCKEMVDAMGGQDSEHYRQFKVGRAGVVLLGLTTNRMWYGASGTGVALPCGPP